MSACICVLYHSIEVLMLDFTTVVHWLYLYGDRLCAETGSVSSTRRPFEVCNSAVVIDMAYPGSDSNGVPPLPCSQPL